MTNDFETKAKLEAEDVRRLCGEIVDWKVRAIIESGASIADVELAMARLTGADDILRDQPQPLDGAAALVYDLLASGEDFPGESDPGDRRGG
jgi:hypothetical protein